MGQDSEKYVIRGGKRLEGEVVIAGAKNAALGILAAAVMTDDKVTIENVPNVSDTRTLLKAIENIGATVEFKDEHTVVICGKGVRACNFEFQLPRPSYTYKTLEALRRTFPERRFSLLIGADNWHAFPRWRANEELLRTTDIYVYPRQSYDIDAAILPPRVHLTAAPLYPISSTVIRQRAAKGESIAGLLPKSIEEEVRAYYRANMLKV